MKALTARVEAERGIVVGDVDVETDVGVAQRDIGAVARLLAELVDDGVFHLVADEVGIAEFLGIDHGVDGEGLALFDVLAPVDFLHLIIYVFCRAGLEVLDGLQHAYGGVQLKVGTVHHFLVSGKRYHAAANLHVVGAQLGELLSQDGFQAHEGLGNEFKFLFHC